MGSAKAAVLPVPVCAQPSRSRPASTCGIAWVWMGVGRSYFSSASVRSSAGDRPRAANCDGETAWAGGGDEPDGADALVAVSNVAEDFVLELVFVLVFGTEIGCIRIAFVDRWADLAPHPWRSKERRGWSVEPRARRVVESVRANRSDSLDAAHDRFRRAPPA